MREANSSKVGLQQKVAGEQSSNCLRMCVCGCRGVKVVTSDLVFHMCVCTVDVNCTVCTTTV